MDQDVFQGLIYYLFQFFQHQCYIGIQQIKQRMSKYKFDLFHDIIRKISIEMALQLSLGQNIYLHQQIDNLLSERTNQERNYLKNLIEPFYYKFRIERKSGRSYVYKNGAQINKFVEQFNVRVSGMNNIKQLTFESIKDQNILKKISKMSEITSEYWFVNFFQIEETIANKRISFNLQKLSGGRYTQCNCLFFSKWKDCKVYIVNDGLITYDWSKNKIREFLAFGKDFYWEVSTNIAEFKLHIHSYHRKLSLKAKTAKQFLLFLISLQNQLQQFKKQQIVYRFNSFGPVRQDNEVEFYVDGAEYFQAVATTIEKAKQDVFICGWWVSPEFYLKRPCIGHKINYRLDNLLTRVAQRGVKIYVIVYFQSSFLTNDSLYTKQALQNRHENIKVLRHPQIVLPTYWSHHEKLIVVDQKRALLGGLDLCYGRYDHQTHLINENSKEIYPGIQYNNCRIADFTGVRNFQTENISRQLPRLPWHDVALSVEGKCVKDLSKHFIEYWNYASYQSHYVDRYILVSTEKTNFLSKFSSGLKQKLAFSNKKEQKKQQKKQKQRQRKFSVKRSQSLFENVRQIVTPKKNEKLINICEKEQQSKSINSERKQISEAIWIKFDIQNETQNQTKNPKKVMWQGNEELNQIEEKQFENRYQGQIDQRIRNIDKTLTEMAKIEQKIQQQEGSDQQPQSEGFIQERQQQVQLPVKGSSLQFIKKPFSMILNITSKKQEINKSYKKSADFVCQAVRSASQWSIGCKSINYEKSIYDAYLSLIGKAERFIYIENQFFISSTHSNGVVKNKIMEALADRTIRAIQNNQVFKVIILLPLIPGFAGELDDPNASLPRVIMNWQYKTICKGENSLIKRIQKKTNEPWKYIQFFGLRTHGVIKQKPYTEIIYLHSKLMIVDDKYLICGSANINDRSMVGDRDSELCLVVEGKQEAVNKINYMAVKKIYELRIRLWEEHFAVQEQQSQNPLCQKLWNKIIERADKNTMIFRQLFGCYPDDTVSKLEDIKKLKVEPNMKTYQQKSSQIKGHAVLFPTKFLSQQKLTSFLPNQIST